VGLDVSFPCYLKVAMWEEDCNRYCNPL